MGTRVLTDKDFIPFLSGGRVIKEPKISPIHGFKFTIKDKYKGREPEEYHCDEETFITDWKDEEHYHLSDLKKGKYVTVEGLILKYDEKHPNMPRYAIAKRICITDH